MKPSVLWSGKKAKPAAGVWWVYHLEAGREHISLNFNPLYEASIPTGGPV
jgi:hypothetical protein